VCPCSMARACNRGALSAHGSRARQGVPGSRTPRAVVRTARDGTPAACARKQSCKSNTGVQLRTLALALQRRAQVQVAARRPERTGPLHDRPTSCALSFTNAANHPRMQQHALHTIEHQSPVTKRCTGGAHFAVLSRGKEARDERSAESSVCVVAERGEAGDGRPSQSRTPSRDPLDALARGDGRAGNDGALLPPPYLTSMIASGLLPQ